MHADLVYVVYWIKCLYCLRILTWNYGINHRDQCITK